MWLLDAMSSSLTRMTDEHFEVQPEGAAQRKCYGILSHRWERDEEEAKFEDFRFSSPSRTNQGIRKIRDCSRIAQSHNLGLLWSDTCCIDKTSSAELQEAINSMYRYYARAEICFVYLRDFSVGDSDECFIRSEWFTRGWTLQELLAPTDVRFYDCNWVCLGDKRKLSRLVSAATGIQEDVLTGQTQIQECSVAQRMSWASKRRTTRVEDRAYSLLGIFDVNMTMLYGEGQKSFVRLQEEIIKTLDDHSIFAWRGIQHGLPGLLASSPDAFASSGDIESSNDRTGRRPYAVNNRGVHGMVPLIPYTLDTYLTLLPCKRRGSAQHVRIGIFLRRLQEDDQYLRVSVLGQELVDDATACLIQYGATGYCLARDISIRQRPLLLQEMSGAYVERMQGFRLGEDLLKRDRDGKPLFSTSGRWNATTQTISLPPCTRKIHHVGSVNIGQQDREIEQIRFGFDYDYNPVIYLTHKGIRYSEKEDHRGVFMETFQETTQRQESLRLVASGETFQNASPALGGHWSECEQVSDGTLAAHMSTKVNGFWAVKGDRIDGWKGSIVRHRQQSGESTLARVARVSLRRGTVDGYIVWDLQIDDLIVRQDGEAHEDFESNRGAIANTLRGDIQEITRQVDGISFSIKNR